MSGAKSLLRSTATVSLLRGGVMVLALVHGMVSAAAFGTSTEKDCYLIAHNIPSLLQTILVGGFYPTLLVTLAGLAAGPGCASATVLTRRVLFRAMWLLAPLCLATIFLAPWILRAAAPGFPPSQVLLGARLLQITAITMVGAVAVAILKSLFDARQQFAVPGTIGLLTGGVSLLTLLLLVDRIGIFALAVGPLMGTASGLLVMFVMARRRDGGSSPAPGTGEAVSAPSFRWGDLVPMSIAANFGQVNMMVDNAFVSFLPAGSVAILGFAFVIVSNSEALTIYSLAEVALPRFAAAAARGGDALRDLLRQHLRYMSILTFPLSAGALTFGLPLTRLLFERGQFGPESSLAVAAALSCYALQIAFIGHQALFWRTLVAIRRMRALVWVSLGAMLGNAVLDYILMRAFGLNGIAVATTLMTLVLACVLGRLLRSTIGPVHGPGEIGFLARVAACAAGMGVLTLGWRAGFESLFGGASQGLRLAEVLGGLAVSAAFYAGLLHLAGIGEVKAIIDRVWRTAVPARTPR